MNFTRGDLPRQLRSEVTPKTCVNELCVLDATSSTFQNIVMEEDKVCVICILLSVAMEPNTIESKTKVISDMSDVK